jgi:Prokaryotic N-terminal methylation motif
MNRRSKPGFTLVELIGAIVIIIILCSVILVVSGDARSRALQTRVSADIEALNSAKVHWTLDHPGFGFPSSEADRFSAIKRYLDPVQVAAGVTDLSHFAPQGVTYSIGALDEKSSSNPAF